MTRTQFWILNATVALVGVLFATQIFLARQIFSTQQNIAVLQKTIQEGGSYYSRWEKLAVRTYQLSQKDPALKDVLVRQQIKITPKADSNPALNSPKLPSAEAPVQPTKAVPKK